jgi:hypothetical protein
VLDLCCVGHNHTTHPYGTDKTTTRIHPSRIRTNSPASFNDSWVDVFQPADRGVRSSGALGRLWLGINSCEDARVHNRDSNVESEFHVCFASPRIGGLFQVLAAIRESFAWLGTSLE